MAFQRANRMAVTASAAEPHELVFASCLAGLAGLNDGLMFIAFGVFVSFMSGNATVLGSMAGFNAPLAIAAILALLSFTLGAMLGDCLVDTTTGFRRPKVIAGELVLITCATLAAAFGIGKMPIVCILASAMGVQTSALDPQRGVSVAVTGTVASLGRVMGRAFRGLAPASEVGPPALLLLVWIGGACLGGLLAHAGLLVALGVSVAYALALFIWSVLRE